ADGTNLLFSSYLGGSDIDQAFAIALDSAGDAYVTGSTSSTNFNIKNALYSTNSSNATGRFDAFITKVKGDGSALVYSTYLGGSGLDEAYGIAVDSPGVYVTGVTSSTNFKLANAIQTNNAGSSDAFVTKINPQGTALLFSTYFGGSRPATTFSVAVGTGH